MSDVEYILEANHRRARERELGERWDEIERKQKRETSLLRAAGTACFSVACVLLGGTAVLLGFLRRRLRWAARRRVFSLGQGSLHDLPVR